MSGAAFKLAATLAAALLLVTGVFLLTRDRIAQQHRQAELMSLAQVLPPALYDNDPIEDHIRVLATEVLGGDAPRKVYRGRVAGNPSALAIQVTAEDGYNGDIDLLVGIRYDGTLIGVRILQHRETPGLGDAIHQDKSDWIEMFSGRSLGDPPADRWKVRRDGGAFDQLTGATISPRAVTGAVRRTLEYYSNNKQELFAPRDEPNE